jgi:hypothetical protein
MNERLKELMLKSGTHKYISEECQHRIETLFKLVVQECADCCGSQADKKNIRKRFGLPVESNVKYEGPDAHGSITSQYTREYNLPK